MGLADFQVRRFHSFLGWLKGEVRCMTRGMEYREGVRSQAWAMHSISITVPAPGATA
jgi:hypothetical protein